MLKQHIRPIQQIQKAGVHPTLSVEYSVPAEGRFPRLRPATLAAVPLDALSCGILKHTRRIPLHGLKGDHPKKQCSEHLKLQLGTVQRRLRILRILVAGRHLGIDVVLGPEGTPLTLKESIHLGPNN